MDNKNLIFKNNKTRIVKPQGRFHPWHLATQDGPALDAWIQSRLSARKLSGDTPSPTKVGNLQVDGLVRLTGLTQTQHKMHPQPPNSVP